MTFFHMPGVTAAHGNAQAVDDTPKNNEAVIACQAQAVNFLRDYLAPSGIHLCSILPDAFDPRHAITSQYFGNDWQRADEWAQAENAKGRNIYWTSNVVRPGLNRKPKKGDLTAIRIAHTDIDPPKDGEWNKSAALAALISQSNPSFVIDSGNGLQAVWWLSSPTDVETIERINIGIGERFGADHCWNADRLLRLPGTINYPDAKKQAAGRVPVKAEIAAPFNGLAFTPADLLACFPTTRPVQEVIEELPEGPCEGYTGPEDDDELIRMMLASRGSAASAFGDRANVTDLWYARDLGRFFPDAAREFDHSAADASLLSHMAFWTGKDAGRMSRLFERSALMRDKWRDRAEYAKGSIKKAVANCSSFYNKPRNEPVAMMPGMTEAPVTTSTFSIASDFLGKYAYVPSRGQNKCIVPIAAATADAGYSEPAIKRMLQNECKMEKGSATGALEFWFQYEANQASSMQLRPDKPFPFFVDAEGQKVLNTWRAPSHSVSGCDVSLFTDRFMRHLLPDDEQRAWFVQWLAYKWRNPANRGVAVLMVASEQFGTGRGTLMKFIDRLFQGRFVRTLKWETLVGEGSQAQFNAWAAETVFLMVDEIGRKEGQRRYEENRAIYERLKTVVDTTTDSMDVNVKGVSPFRARIFFSTLSATNNKNAVALPSGDRRFTVLENGEVMPQELATALHTAADDHSFVAGLANWLDRVDLTGFNPNTPLATSIKSEMSEAFETPLDVAVKETVIAFPGEVFTAMQLYATVCNAHYRFSVPPKMRAVTEVASRFFGRIRTKNDRGVDTRLRELDAKHVVFARSDPFNWKKADNAIIRAEVEKNGSLNGPPMNHQFLPGEGGH